MLYLYSEKIMIDSTGFSLKSMCLWESAQWQINKTNIVRMQLQFLENKQ